MTTHNFSRLVLDNYTAHLEYDESFITGRDQDAEQQEESFSISAKTTRQLLDALQVLDEDRNVLASLSLQIVDKYIVAHCHSIPQQDHYKDLIAYANHFLDVTALLLSVENAEVYDPLNRDTIDTVAAKAQLEEVLSVPMNVEYTTAFGVHVDGYEEPVQLTLRFNTSTLLSAIDFLQTLVEYDSRREILEDAVATERESLQWAFDNLLGGGTPEIGEVFAGGVAVNGRDLEPDA